MKKENILLLAASGFIVANLFAKTIEKDKGFYDGWIEHKTVPFKKFALTHDAYHGGILKKENAKLACYEFWVDSKTGSILKICRTAQF